MLYPAVPVPPMGMSAPHAASVEFMVICVACFAVAVAYVAWAARRGEYLGGMLLVSGLLAGVLEPMLDSLGLLWFARNNVAVAVTAFHRFVPLYVVLGYSFFFGGLAYVAYQGLVAGKPAAWFWKLYAAAWLLDFALQATGAAIGLYKYYGQQPFMIFGTPAWWFSIDATLPALAAAVLFAFRDRLTGWRWLLAIPVVPALYAGVNGAEGWPVFEVINSHVPAVVLWLGGAVTIAFALLVQVLVLAQIRRLQSAAGIAASAEAPVRAASKV